MAQNIVGGRELSIEFRFQSLSSPKGLDNSSYSQVNDKWQPQCIVAQKRSGGVITDKEGDSR